MMYSMQQLLKSRISPTNLIHSSYNCIKLHETIYKLQNPC